MDADDLERMLRRVVREELQRFHVGGIRAPHVIERGRRGAQGDDDEGARNTRRTLEYAIQIDPDNTMPKEELLHLMRLKFPEIDF
jgi:hypothetical protein